MSRPLRLELAGGLYHVTSRGDGREDIYLSDDTDREVWLEVFGQVCKRFNWVCHAWCQMTNHYHILIETPGANLAGNQRGQHRILFRDSPMPRRPRIKFADMPSENQRGQHEPPQFSWSSGLVPGAKLPK